jgi:hypothetical protein
MKNSKARSRVLISIILLGLTASNVNAQNFSGAGESWSSSWGFSSVSDRSLALQQAQVIKNAEQGVSPTSVSNNYVTNSTLYDNRSNYVEANAGGGVITTDQHIVGNDEIGQKTYAVGSINTGSTTIDVLGSDNTVSAINSADSKGCIDGSVSSSAVDVPASGSLLANLITDTTGDIDAIVSGNGVRTSRCY